MPAVCEAPTLEEEEEEEDEEEEGEDKDEDEDEELQWLTKPCIPTTKQHACQINDRPPTINRTASTAATPMNPTASAQRQKMHNGKKCTIQRHQHNNESKFNQVNQHNGSMEIIPTE